MTLPLPPSTVFVPMGQSRLEVVLSDNGGTFAVASADGVLVLSARDGKVRRRFDSLRAPVALSADGSLCAAWGTKGGLEIVRIADSVRVQRITPEGSAGVIALAFSPGARLLMATMGSGFSTFLGGRFYLHYAALVWDLQSGTLVSQVPEGRPIASGDEGSVGATADERQYIGALTWNMETREVAGTVYPSILAYWTVPSGMVTGQLVVWRLSPGWSSGTAHPAPSR